jgi:hypothetical protein
VGWLTLGISVLGSAVMLAAIKNFADSQPECTHGQSMWNGLPDCRTLPPPPALLVTGTLLLVLVGIPVGAILAAQGDSAEISIVPLSMPLPRASARSEARATPAGFAVDVRF